jgi:hypothetical protein
VNDRPIPEIALSFGDRVFQYIRPKKFARVDSLEFAYITSDLFTIEDFARDTLEIGSLHFGNRGFQLFKDAKLENMVGLDLPYSIVCHEEDRANLRTLVSLMKKCRRLVLDRTSRTWPII